jgi:hypothetical protein
MPLLFRRLGFRSTVFVAPGTAVSDAQIQQEAFPSDTGPSDLLRDRDHVYGPAFRQRVKGMGIGEVLTAPSSPWQNPFAGRLIGSIRRECVVRRRYCVSGTTSQLKPQTQPATPSAAPSRPGSPFPKGGTGRSRGASVRAHSSTGSDPWDAYARWVSEALARRG